MQGTSSSRQNPLHDSTEFYVQCAIKFVHKHVNFRRKPVKGNGRGRIREGKERGPRVPSYAAGRQYYNFAVSFFASFSFPFWFCAL